MAEVGEQQSSQQEIPHYSPDHKLTPDESGKEADRLIGQFADIFNNDADLQNVIKDQVKKEIDRLTQQFPGVPIGAFTDGPWGNNNTQHGPVGFKKGDVEYVVDTSSAIGFGEFGNRMMISRTEGDDNELLWLAGENRLPGSHLENRTTISHIHKKGEKEVTWTRNNGIAVDGGRTLLEKVKRDFKKS